MWVTKPEVIRLLGFRNGMWRASLSCGGMFAAEFLALGLEAVSIDETSPAELICPEGCSRDDCPVKVASGAIR